MKRLLPILLLTLCGASAVAAEFTIIGSRTMHALNKELADRFRQTHSGTPFRVSDAGTGKGIDALIAGKADVAAVTRPLRPEEKKEFSVRHRHEPFVFPIAVEGIVVYVHPRNRVDSLSVDQLARVFSGEITNWKELGGADLPIHVYSFDKSTGRYWYVLESILGKRTFVAGTRYTGSSDAVSSAAALAAQQEQMLQLISADPAGIGYGDFTRARVVKFARISTNGGRGYLPAPDELQRGTYPLSRTLMYVLRSEPEGTLAEFVRWSREQEDLIRGAGFVPVR
jgi:phosphate transport system substrate-binding protein